MCEYCGCQQNTVIAELTAEHDRLRELGHDLAGAVNAGDASLAAGTAGRMLAVLGPHTSVEESALFPVLATDFPDQLAQLVTEHREIEAALAELVSHPAAAGWRRRTQLALAHLFDHILKEQDGVFPAALATLTTADWEALEQARDRVHTASPV